MYIQKLRNRAAGVPDEPRKLFSFCRLFLHWLPMNSSLKSPPPPTHTIALNGLGHSYLGELAVPYQPNVILFSQNADELDLQEVVCKPEPSALRLLT